MFRVLGERCVLAGLCSCFLVIGAAAGEEPPRQGYVNRLTPIANPPPLLADHPEFVEPIHEMMRYEAPALAQEACANLRVRAWRFSYNARGIIEIPNALRADHTAIIVVHPWAIDDGQGWRTPEPAGAAFACTPAKNRICLNHMARVVDPFLKSLRGKVRLIAYQPARRRGSCPQETLSLDPSAAHLRGPPPSPQRAYGKAPEVPLSRRPAGPEDDALFG